MTGAIVSASGRAARPPPACEYLYFDLVRGAREVDARVDTSRESFSVDAEASNRRRDSRSQLSRMQLYQFAEDR